jgi:hypothetical protein
MTDRRGWRSVEVGMRMGRTVASQRRDDRETVIVDIEKNRERM